MSEHGHGHDHAVRTGAGHGRKLAMVLGISGTILVVEVVGAIVSGSLALLADAGHMLTDVAGLSLALIAATLANRPATDERTWGYRRAEVLAAAAQAAVLLGVGMFVLIEGIKRLLEPPDVGSTAMIIFGLVGLFGNAVSILVLSRIQGGNMNTRAALLEVINDALGALAVLIAAVVIATTGWLRADAVASLLIGVLILPRTWKLLRETVDVLLEATPKGVELAQVRSHLLEVDHVQAVHDLHASTVATNMPVLTAHVVVDDSCFHDGHVPQLLDELQQCLTGHFDVEHSTFQFEPSSHAAHEHQAHA
ncbi:MAG TPA: cation diffusion facilitator family transporter [Gemmatimonadales bacterium]|nr:cation diffusion facilitator family transporter [Gemmatimonadales bacterium]